ncbi:hypothetical protein [Alkalihalobacillus sp. 1P02AB]|uniref:hypothetical protein n=1 Tax=Alkalihalobacillus sp. 1P02AB TaxID=3132260 RepID=UPI0039A6E82C
MTYILSEMTYWILIALIIVFFVFLFSLAINYLIKLKAWKVSKRIEMLISVSLTIVLVTIYFIFEDKLTLNVYEGDLVVTEEEVQKIDQTSAKVISTENPMIIYHLYTLGFFDTLTIASDSEYEVEVSVLTTDFEKLYPYYLNESFDLNDGSFHFAQYYEKILIPKAEEVLLELIEMGYEGDELQQRFNELMDLDFPQHNFELAR